MVARILAVVALLAAIGAATWYFWPRELPPPPSSAAPSAAQPVAPAPQGPKHPIEVAAVAEQPLPPLKQSDPAMKDTLRGLWNDKAIAQFFNVTEFVRRVVATVDNLPRQKIALRLMPLKQAPGQFRASSKGSELTVHPDNSARYAPYVAAAEAVDATKLVDAYVRFYPLFQQAYEDLGYPKSYFNDRLVEVIDHLLAAPEMPANAKLVQPKVFYQFADPDLEKRSAGQKIMMRIGNENAARVKAKLRDIRGQLTRRGPKP